ncbi:MAG: excinuclease ABC subunit A [Candidatus Schekmanbacteria bacterium]|nr:MAG: excinuclease ABC subunit A [Candidatus Schekmanbacteria bacterium]
MKIKGARVNNLKNISCTIPAEKITIITGISGSGKSSLAFDTIYAEGQRRYVDCLSTYARQFIERVQKPDVDEIIGIQPAIAVEQKNNVKNSRSTVGSISEINDYLKLLFAKCGTIFCPRCGVEAQKFSPQSLADYLCEKYGGKTVISFIPLSSISFANDEEILENLQKKGFTRILKGNQLKRIDELEKNSFGINEEIEVVSDRFEISHKFLSRITESIESAFQHKSSKWGILTKEKKKKIFNLYLSCPECGQEFNEFTPSQFSFNSPAGACEKCHGFGRIIDYDIDKIIPDKNKPIKEGAVAPWNSPAYEDFYILLRRAFLKNGISFSSSFNDLPENGKRILLDGSGDFPGIRGFFKLLEDKRYKLHIRVFLAKYRMYEICPHCNGSRLKGDALIVKIRDKNIYEIQQMPIKELKDFFASTYFDEEKFKPAQVIVKEIRSRIDYLYNVGLGYLTLDRQARTLSGGEMQRINLSKALGAFLTGTLYVLDEPTVGLHPRDTDKLKKVLFTLSKRGNTLVIVEHDESVISMADHIIDLGPGAGEKGGEVVFEGTFEELKKDRSSLTAQYLGMPPTMAVKKKESFPTKFIALYDVRKNNIKGENFKVPLNMLVSITGVSGSGKSTFLKEIFYPAIKRAKAGLEIKRKNLSKIEGVENIDDVILVDQSPPGKSARSNPVTYVKAYGEIRKIMAKTREAKKVGIKEVDFSFNAGNGRCEKCLGLGVEKIEMQFLADLNIICEECNGTGFKEKILSIKNKGKNIFDILNMTVFEAIDFFSDEEKITEKLAILEEMGLGYLRLGQKTSTLSGGESQRLKLAGLLSGKKKSAKYLFLFDEPTTGLHMADVENLVKVFRKMIAEGHSVVTIEHNPDFILQSDYIIDLGPEGGDEGGRIVCEGNLDDIITCGRSYTGRYLLERLSMSKNKDRMEERNEIIQ